ncbi:MAG: N-acetyltransferase family protein [Pseudomonadota bacterium]
MALSVRAATGADSAAICAIHNAVIAQSAITFTSVLRDEADVAARIAGGQPHWVLDAGGAVQGFATFSAFRAGPGYAHTFEHTIFVAPAAQGAGAGRALMAALEAGARAAGGHVLLAGLSGENAAGAAFHAALGFQEVARLAEVGWKLGRWHDLVLMQKFLSPRGAER